ncbi:antibiotic biosynthesis monooxygenase [Xanthomonas campestris pv. spermacoces]|uniref:putative quinol monooxygenase n=1 Tax=Xanthomonas euvesicatoria TaxID=456327 RepID=UPI001C464666|nr:putative quinol monooxygenase [Xanthomonas euvesicatoria]MBV6886430.1 antibiotic biosynthesis monooxygenase [Xanthomonas campestris pv. spermacoces]
MKSSTGNLNLIHLVFALLFVCSLAQANDQSATENAMKPANPFAMKPPENTSSSTYVRWSMLEVDPTRMDSFKALGNENVRETRRNDPGVLAFYWAGEKDHPNRVRVLEVYADENAYKAHLASAHYQKFRDASRPLLKGHALFEAVPVVLGAKPQLPPPTVVVRMAEIEIDPARLEAYKAIVTEEIEASIRTEPGVFAIYAVALKDRPNQLRFFEIYADEDAYLHHRATPHFQKYLNETKGMITARNLMEAAPGSLAH